jgi:alpha-beta hydrolase superfamily lysophospholipase
LSLNAVASLGAYSLTHFRTPGQLGLGQPKLVSTKLPSDIGLSYTTQRIPVQPEEWLEAWYIPTQNATAKGTVLLFPGNGGSKARQLLAPAQVFHNLGYDTLLIDFRGVGGSSGSTTTLGMREAEDVAIAANYAQNNFDSPVVLYGVSMGSAAILRAVAAEGVQPDAIILELPFSTMLNAVRSRLREARAPTFPLAELAVFWGSVQHGFNGFAHNPVVYAKQVTVPTLILQGELDKWTTSKEIDRLFGNLGGEKRLAIFPNVGHNLLVTVDRELWQQENSQFLDKL